MQSKLASLVIDMLFTRLTTKPAGSGRLKKLQLLAAPPALSNEMTSSIEDFKATDPSSAENRSYRLGGRCVPVSARRDVAEPHGRGARCGYWYG